MRSLTQQQSHQEAGYFFPYHYLDLSVPEYTYLWHIEYLNYLQTVKQLLKSYNCKSVLDTGCGDGRFCYELKKDGFTVTGVDYSERALQFAKAFNPEVPFSVQNIEHLRFKQQFDAVVLIETLEHIIPERIPLVLKSIANIMHKNSIFIITVPTTNQPLADKHYQHFTPNHLTATLSSYFTIVQLLGDSNTGYKRSVYLFLKKICYLLFPLRKKLPFIQRGLVFLQSYYKKHLANGDPNTSLRLIAVCKKK
ncbi:class I SAM-dependent methyltransferase [Candidatus Woesearchaeota archaeon]|nr:class I SAM-dependent methyltransferase [Candidatus Woesearchaeota archaeon]